jgi:hypothetical protein
MPPLRVDSENGHRSRASFAFTNARLCDRDSTRERRGRGTPAAAGIDPNFKRGSGFLAFEQTQAFRGRA